MGRFICAGTWFACCWLGQAHAATIDESMREARELLAGHDVGAKPDENRFVALALNLARGCPATIDAEVDGKARKERKQTIAALIAAVAESGSMRGFAKLLQLASCGVESPLWGREHILERAMAHTIAAVPCLLPLSGEIADEREKLAEFPILRPRKGILRAELPTPAELDDLAYFMVAVAEAGEEVGARDEGASWKNKAPANATRAELFEKLAAAKSAGNVFAIERWARAYLETLDFPNPLHGAEEDVLFWHAPRFHYVMRDLAESWEALGRYHEAAGLWRRTSRTGAACGTAAAYAWQEQVKAVIRDEEIDGRCDTTVAERLLDVGGSRWNEDDQYGTRRLVDAKFDVPRLLRGALLTINRDAGEVTVKKALDGLPEIPRLFAQMRLREKGSEDWERRLQAARGVADTMQEAAIPLLLLAAEQSLPPGRQRAISALGDLAERPPSNPCGNFLVSRSLSTGSEWVRPVRPLEESCKGNRGPARRNRLARALSAYARDRDAGTREAVAVALGKIAAPSSRAVLQRLSRDGATDGTVCSEASATVGSSCHAHFPVREAARQALSNLAELEVSWRESLKANSMGR